MCFICALHVNANIPVTAITSYLTNWEISLKIAENPYTPEKSCHF